MLQFGAAWGRGISTRWGNGWIAADGAVRYRLETEGIVAKLDLTVGIKPFDRAKLFVQVQAGRYPDADPYLRVVPSVAYRIAPGRHIELGVPVGLAGDNSVGVKIGTWLEF